MRALVNQAADPASVAAPGHGAAAFHRSLPGYQPTPLRPLDSVARDLGLASAARFGAQQGATVIGVEPETAACLTASLADGTPTTIETPGTAMAGLDCAEVSAAAWPDLEAGIAGTITISDGEAREAMADLAALGLAIGECGAAPLAALRALATERECDDLREKAALGPSTKAVLIGTEGPTGQSAL